MNSDTKRRRGLYWLVALPLAVAAAWAGIEFYVSAWVPYQAEQPIKKKLEQFDVRFFTEGTPGRVVDAFAPHSFVPEDCLADLAKLKRLRRIELIGRPLSNAAIATLSEMKQLESVHLMFASDEQLETLQASLPHCQIIREMPGYPPASTLDGNPE